MKLAKTGFGDLAIWVEEDKSAPLAIVPNHMDKAAQRFETRIIDLKADHDSALQELDKAKDCIHEIIEKASIKFIDENGWEQCPHAEATNDDPCECPAWTMKDEYSKWLFDGCAPCPFYDCC